MPEDLYGDHSENDTEEDDVVSDNDAGRSVVDERGLEGGFAE